MKTPHHNKHQDSRDFGDHGQKAGRPHKTVTFVQALLGAGLRLAQDFARIGCDLMGAGMNKNHSASWASNEH